MQSRRGPRIERPSIRSVVRLNNRGNWEKPDILNDRNVNMLLLKLHIGKDVMAENTV